jgi:hypothetical protein
MVDGRRFASETAAALPPEAHHAAKGMRAILMKWSSLKLYLSKSGPWTGLSDSP